MSLFSLNINKTNQAFDTIYFDQPLVAYYYRTADMKFTTKVPLPELKGKTKFTLEINLNLYTPFLPSKKTTI